MTGHRTYLDLGPRRSTSLITTTKNPELIDRVRKAKAAGVQDSFRVAA